MSTHPRQRCLRRRSRSPAAATAPRDRRASPRERPHRATSPGAHLDGGTQGGRCHPCRHRRTTAPGSTRSATTEIPRRHAAASRDAGPKITGISGNTVAACASGALRVPGRQARRGRASFRPIEGCNGCRASASRRASEHADPDAFGNTCRRGEASPHSRSTMRPRALQDP